jgi:hypothetical protein
MRVLLITTREPEIAEVLAAAPQARRFFNCSTSVRETNTDGASRVGGDAHRRKGHSNNRLGNTPARKRPEHDPLVFS